MGENGEEIEATYEEYLKWEEEQRIKKKKIMEQQEIEVQDIKAYFYLDENGNKVPLSKEQYKTMKK